MNEIKTIERVKWVGLILFGFLAGVVIGTSSPNAIRSDKDYSNGAAATYSALNWRYRDLESYVSAHDACIKQLQTLIGDHEKRLMSDASLIAALQGDVAELYRLQKMPLPPPGPPPDSENDPRWRSRLVKDEKGVYWLLPAEAAQELNEIELRKELK